MLRPLFGSGSVKRKSGLCSLEAVIDSLAINLFVDEVFETYAAPRAAKKKNLLFAQPLLLQGLLVIRPARIAISQNCQTSSN